MFTSRASQGSGAPARVTAAAEPPLRRLRATSPCRSCLPRLSLANWEALARRRLPSRRRLVAVAPTVGTDPLVVVVVVVVVAGEAESPLPSPPPPALVMGASAARLSSARLCSST